MLATTLPLLIFSSTEFLLISNGVIAQFTTDGDGGWDYVPIGPLGVNFASTIAGLDGSAWALDDKGQAWIIDETQVSLFNGSNNPPFKQLCVVDSQTIYGLDNNGNVYLWSSFANSFINLASTITNLPTFSQIQVDEQGILYGITTQNTSYQVVDISAALSLTNPNAPAFGVTTATDSSGVTHAIWNENGQIYYGYQQVGGNGQYIGVTPLNGGIGTANQGSSTNLTLTSTDSGAIAASWISGSNENAEVYTAQLSASPYGGYQWSAPLNITNDDAADSNLEVVALNNNRLLVTTQKKGKSNHRIVDLNQLALTPQTPTKSTFQPKGQGFTYQISAEDLASSSGIITLPSNFSLELGLGTGNLSQLSESVEKALNGWSLNIQLAAGGTTNKPSADSPFAYNSLRFSLTVGKEAGGIGPAVLANSLAAGLFKGYVSLDLSFFAQGSGSWDEVGSYPSSAKAKAGGEVELEVNAINLVLNSLFPGSGAFLNELSEAGILNIQGGPVVGVELTYTTDVEFDNPETNLGGVEASDYFFELFDKSNGPNGGPPDESSSKSDLRWELDLNKFFSFLGDTFTSTSGDSFFNLDLDTGLYLKVNFADGFINFSIKGVQTEEFNKGSNSGLKLEQAVFTSKAKATFNFFIFSVSYGAYERIVEASASGLSTGEVLSQNKRNLPATVSYEPNSTTFLLRANSSGLLGENNTNLVDSADIAYIIAPNGTTVYGTFAGAVNDDSANFSYLYFVEGILNGDSISWNADSLEVIPQTAGANQSPSIALDGNGNVVISWQYESITNPTVQQIATTPPGQVYVVYGQGGNNSVDLANFSENPANANSSGFYWTLDNEYFASFGQAVTALGDVNGGGKADFAIASPDLNDEQGGVYVIFAEEYEQVNNLSDLGNNGLFLTGQALSELGYSISNAGDVNGDGIPDLIVGAPGLNNNQGGAYLLYGGQLFTTPQSQNNIDALLQGNPSYGKQITNPNGQAGDRFGTSVTGGQDFNGDNQADYAISAPSANQESGEITLILSQFIADNVFLFSVDNQGNLVLTNQTTNLELWNSNTAHLVPDPEYATGYIAKMEENGNFTLSETAGNAEIEYWSTGTGGNPGAYLALGTDGGLYIRNQQGTNIYTFHSGSNLNNPIFNRLTAGNNISSNDPNSSLTSPNTPGGTITLTNITSTVNGNPLLDLGEISLIPDVNQDGKADLLISGTGAAVILFGSTLSTQTLDLATINPGQGFVLIDDSDSPMPLQVSSAGDVNGDGINDLIVGYPLTQDAQGNNIPGNSYVLFGGSSLSATQNNSLGFSQLNGTNGFTIIGAGTQVTGAGDVNGDSVADLLVSDPQSSNQAGISYVIYGGTTNQIGTVASINVNQVGTTVQGYVIGQAGANQLSGSSVSAVGDLNGDGKADLLVGAPNTVSTDALNALQTSITSNYIVGQVNSGGFTTTNLPAPIPYLQVGQVVQSLTSTAFGFLAVWIAKENNTTNISTAFWKAGGIGWTNYNPSVASLSDPNLSFSQIEVSFSEVGVNKASSNSITLSWSVTNAQTSTSTLGQSIYNDNNPSWNTQSFQTAQNPSLPSQIDNVITQNTAEGYTVQNPSAKESDGKVIFTITRQGDISTAKTLSYRTVDITATAGSDYEHTEGVLSFASGETTKTIEIKVHDDTLNEHLNEKFKLVLDDGQSLSFSSNAVLRDSSPEINLLAIDSGFQMVGPGDALLGYAIYGAGNVDGDVNPNASNTPLDDFFITAPGDNSSQGVVYLIAGQVGIEVLNQGVDVDNLTATQGLKITGLADTSAQAGYGVVSWSNTDTTYYVITAPNITSGGTGNSTLYVFDQTTLNQYFKKQTTVIIDALDSSPVTGSNNFGQTVILADLNNDGTPELIVGSPLSDQVLIYSLSSNGGNLTKTLVATISAPTSNQGLGSSLQALDINGDGHLDLAIGASIVNPVADSSGQVRGYGGAVYVLLGNGSIPTNTPLATTNPSTYLVLDGGTSLTGGNSSGSLNPSTGQPSSNPKTNYAYFDQVGGSLASLDFNNDGKLDLVIGAPGAAVGMGANATSNLGKVYVVFGQDGSPSVPNLSEMQAGQGVIFEGVLANGQAGWAVANGGDINKDGINDLLIGAPFAYGNAGSAYIAFGSSNAYGVNNPLTYQLDPDVSDSRVFQYQGIANAVTNTNPFNPGSLGQAIGGIGDVNGDRTLPTGGDDILLGAPSSDNALNQGQIYAAIGHPWLQGGLSLNVNDLRSDNGFIELNANPAVGVGDVNGDGYADFINTNGQLTLGASTLTNVSQQRTFTLAGTLQNNPAFFTSGDFNADGYQDIVALGTLGSNTGLIIYTGGGVTQNILGGQFLASHVSNVIQTTTGDINGDGYDDLLVLSSLSNPNEGQGQVTIYFGSASGLNNLLPPITQTINDPNVYRPGEDQAIQIADIDGDGTGEIMILAWGWQYNQQAAISYLFPSIWQYTNQQLQQIDSPSLSSLETWSSTSIDPFFPPTFINNNRLSSGDINGDGYQDILLSSRLLIDPEQVWLDQEEEVFLDYVFYGSEDLSDFGQNKFLLTDYAYLDTNSNTTNSSQTSTIVGDVNGDGFDDVLVDQFVSTSQGTLHLGSKTNPLTAKVTVQGLPNRTTPYQQGRAGDINGDGLDDFLMADQDNQLTYAIYGQDWEPQTATWNSNATVQSMEGTNGNDVFQGNPTGNFLLSINGQNGDDYVNTPILSDFQTQLFLFKGGQGDDQFGLPATDSGYITQIDGGGGHDTLFIQEVAGPANGIDLTKLYQKISNIEEIDLGYDDSVIFDLNSLLQILDSNKTLIINGVNSFAKPSDQNNSNWSQMGEDTYNGKIYQIYSYVNTAVEVWIQKGGVTWTPSSIALQQSLSSYQGIFLLNGNQLNLLTNLISTNTSNVNELGIFKVDNDQGYINGLAPDSPDYLKAALDSDRTQVLFSAISDRPNGFTVEQIQRVLDVSLDHKFGFYVIENSTTDTVQNQFKETGETTIPIFLSTSPNLTISEPVAGSYQLDWSDSAIGSEGANSLTVETQGSQEKLVEGSQLQGNAQSEVLDLRKLKGTVNIEASLYREAGYNNTVGFYAVDLEGKVVDPLTGLAVTDSPTKDNAEDYLQKALQHRVNIALSVENQSTVTQVSQLQGGLLYAPFLVQDGSFLLLEDNDLSNNPQVFFPYLGVNSDKVDHLRLLGNNLFGFEDLTGGGDLDYNDVIVKVNLLV
jgi:hypothetical protein